MAARRGKSQARRNHGNSGGLPGWAWGVIGLLVGVALILGAPQFLRSDGDGFFRPRPDPDAQPAPVAIDADDVVAGDDGAPARRAIAKPTGKAADKRAEYDFYTLLPGKEVALSDAELAATERAENQRANQQQAQAAAAVQAAAGTAAMPTAAATSPLPRPVNSESTAPAPTAVAVVSPVARPATPVAAPTDDSARYLLQAGAFQASGQAEELKARIALLGLGARVESASIGGKTVYRVRMGPYGTAGELAEAKRKLASGGLPGMAIKVQ